MLTRFPRLSARYWRCAATLLLALTASLASAAPRTLDTAFGEVTLTGTPERVVTLYEGALDAAIAVGVQPVGAIVTRGGNQVAEYIQPRVGDVQIVGTPGETNLEAVIALAPDLILASARTTEPQYRLLSRIAPTIVPDVPAFQPDTWKRETRLFARALDRAEAGEAAIARVEARVREVAQQLDTTLAPDRRDAALVRWMPQGPLVMSRGLFSASLLQAVGFQVDDAGIVEAGRPHSHPLSHENLAKVDRHALFLATLNADGEQALAAARQAPAFQRLEVARNHRIVTVNGQLWTSASGPLAALGILDDIAEALTDGPLARPMP